ncbi:MAG: cation:proton antiporter [Acidobacteriales bacterium]|nr:cation:proton antiporter [Terriglobales bacterium]
MAQGPEGLLLIMFAIFVSAKVIGEVFERLHLPAVLGEILAGVGLGPYALGWIAPTDLIHSVADIGAIFLLFSAGLETSPKDLIRVGRKSLTVAIGGVVVPFLLGFIYMKFRGDLTSEAIFVGAAMVATSVGITVRVLGDMHVLSGRTAKIILGAAVFDDILGMLLLAVVAGVAAGSGFQWLHLGVLAVEAGTFALFMIFVAPGIVDRMQPGMERLQNENAPFVLALAFCLLLSWLALKIGMAAIIGAFFAGLMFADSAREWNLLPKVNGITEFLAPYFFFAIGTRLNLRIFNRDVLVAATVITVLAVISKLVGCGLPLLKEGWPTVFRVGVGMMPRGEVALIVALVGLQSNIVSQSNYAIVVFMTALTTLLAPPLMRYLFRGEEQIPTPQAEPLTPVQL